MILPMSSEELERATDEQIIQAYARIGVPNDSAEVYLSIIRHPESRLVVD